MAKADRRPCGDHSEKRLYVAYPLSSSHGGSIPCEKRRVELGTGPVLHVHLDCRGPSSTVALFSFRGRRLQFADRSVISYRRAYPTGLLVDRDVHVTLVPIEDVLFAEAGRPGHDGAGWTESSAYAVACQYPDGRSSLLSDAVPVRQR